MKERISWCKGLTKETDKRVMARSLNIEKIIINKNFNIMSIYKSYVLGVLCGDGYIIKNGIGLNACDKEFVYFFKECLFKVYGFCPKMSIKKPCIKDFFGKKVKSKEQFVCCLSSKKVMEDMYSYNNFKTKSWTIPKEIYNSKDFKIIGMFLRGFFDSEGTVANRYITGCSSNYKGIIQIQRLLLKLNIESKFNNLNRNYEMYEIKIYGKHKMLQFLNKINFTIDRKRKRLIEQLINSPRYLKYPSKKYYEVIELRKRGLGKSKISNITGINISVVSEWIYRNVKPFSVRNGDLNLNGLDQKDISCFEFDN